jgi:DNA-nicking Smr family endonuclease
MSRKRGSSGGGKGGLSPEDEELWRYTARSLEPLKRPKSRVHSAGSGTGEDQPAVFAPKSADGLTKVALNGTMPATKPTPVSPSKRVVKELGTFDPRHARKLRRGHLEIEGRIDLHGMRQSEAHAALSRFLISSAAQGKRWVLVITGKGTPAGRSNESEWHRPFDEPQRGVLKRNVPHWLAEPDLRSIVVSYTEAAVEHGGSGALYVHLRRQNRAYD